MDIIKENSFVKNVYETIAKHFSVTRSYQWSWVESFRSNYATTSILYDIGCGNGRNIGQNTIGVDNCDAFLEICASKSLNVVKGCITNLPFKNHSGDAIQCIAMFHHLTTQERRIQGLKEMIRVLKPKSQILLSVWSLHQPKKIKRTFEYGDNYVDWTDLEGNIHKRYYYIFQLPELYNLFESVNLKIINYKWDCGNEVFILETPEKIIIN